MLSNTETVEMRRFRRQFHRSARRQLCTVCVWGGGGEGGTLRRNACHYRVIGDVLVCKLTHGGAGHC